MIDLNLFLIFLILVCVIWNTYQTHTKVIPVVEKIAPIVEKLDKLNGSLKLK